MKLQQNFRLDEHIVEAVHKHAADEHRTVTQVVELAIMEYLSARNVTMKHVVLPAIIRHKKGGTK